jgi:hypothetical protein
MEGIFILCLGGGGAECRAEKAHVGVKQLSSLCGESQALHFLGETREAETDSLTKRKAHF